MPDTEVSDALIVRAIAASFRTLAKYGDITEFYDVRERYGDVEIDRALRRAAASLDEHSHEMAGDELPF